MMFAVVMGLSGLTIVYQKAQQILGFGGAVANVLVAIDTAVFISVLFFYILKLFKYFDAVKEEFSHPVRINFFAASAISFLLISIVYAEISSVVALTTFVLGTAMQTFFTFYTISFWINKNLEIMHSNPAWFIPIVGNVLVPVAGSHFASVDFLIYYFAIGMFFWIVLTAIVINRIIFHHQLAVKFMPTLFIFIAPPAIGFVAYMHLFDSYDAFAKIIFNLGLFFTFLIFFMYKNFMNLKFFISWWAFTFPLAAISIATMLAYKITHFTPYIYFAYLFIAVTTIVVLIVALKTIQHIFKKEICIQE
jgi:tellurite resistance protein